MTAADTASPVTSAPRRLLRHFVIALISFLTLVDLFATQAILPSLASAYGVKPAAIGSAVNACTLGMAVAGLLVAWFSRRIDRRLGICLSLALLAIPTALLASMPDLTTFAILRIVQGLFMSAAFSLAIAYLAENGAAEEAASALAAYVTGNVASNLVGRLISAGIAEHFGLSANFAFFAALNLAGAALAFAALRRTAPMESAEIAAAPSWSAIFAQCELRAAFAIGFLILFAFIGTFTYVNFVLTAPPIAIGAMQLGFVYFVFVPAMLFTPFAGVAARRFGARPTIAAALGAAVLGLPMLLAPHLASVLAGLILIGAGTFFAQAAATGYVSRAAGAGGGAAGGIYLASYYSGGLVGSVALGQIFDRFGWPATVIALGAALLFGCILASFLHRPDSGKVSKASDLKSDCPAKS